MKALVIGYHAWDVVLPCGELPPLDHKGECPGMITGGGGPAATASVALARLGVDVEYLGVFGDDAPSRMQREELVVEGVVVERCPVETGGRSPLAVAIVDPTSGCRRICWSRGSLRRLRIDEVDPGWLTGIDLLLTDSHEPLAAAVLAREARRRSIPVVLDGGTPRDGVAELMPLVSDAIGSEIFAPRLTGSEDQREALIALGKLGPGRVATTMGERGCLALERGSWLHVPAFDVPVIDTTGAGDAFHAGYAWGLLRGEDFAGALRTGAAVAGLACGGMGGRSALPSPEAVLDLLTHGQARLG